MLKLRRPEIFQPIIVGVLATVVFGGVALAWYSIQALLLINQGIVHSHNIACVVARENSRSEIATGDRIGADAAIAFEETAQPTASQHAAARDIHAAMAVRAKSARRMLAETGCLADTPGR